MQMIGIMFALTMSMAWSISLGRIGIRASFTLFGLGIVIVMAHWPIAMLLEDPFIDVVTLKEIGIGYAMLVVAGYPAIIFSLGSIIFEFASRLVTGNDGEGNNEDNNEDSHNSEV